MLLRYWQNAGGAAFLMWPFVNGNFQRTIDFLLPSL
jgi:hypothetical protein